MTCLITEQKLNNANGPRQSYIMFIEQMTCLVIQSKRRDLWAIEQMVSRANGTRANGHRANGNRAGVVAPA